MEPSWDEVSGTPSMARGAVRRGLTLGKIHKDKHVIKVAFAGGMLINSPVPWEGQGRQCSTKLNSTQGRTRAIPYYMSVREPGWKDHADFVFQCIGNPASSSQSGHDSVQLGNKCRARILNYPRKSEPKVAFDLR